MSKSKDLMLILQCSDHIDEKKEIASIKAQSILYEFDVVVKKPRSLRSIRYILKNTEKLDILYISAHGNSKGFCNQDNSININWLDLAYEICASDCLEDDAILLLSCCRGGLNEIAFDMFWSCPAISYVCGPRQEVESVESIIGFNILLFNILYRNLDPILSCEKIKSGSQIRFKCFDRLETIGEPAYLMRVDKYEKENAPEPKTLSTATLKELKHYRRALENELEKRRIEKSS